jgi:hypothetical protein
MSRHLAIFLLCFAIGAVLTLVVRTIRHQPYTELHPTHDAMAPNPLVKDHP